MRQCADCGRDISATSARRRRCLPCTAVYSRRRDRRHAEAARARGGASRHRSRRVRGGLIKCLGCGKTEGVEWVTRKPAFCLECRGRRELESRARAMRNLYARRRAAK